VGPASGVVLACAVVWRSRSRDGLGPCALLAASAAVLDARLGVHSRWAGEMLTEYVP
jgi:hypothetical protein